MKNRCYSVCCACAVLLTGGMLPGAGVSAETESDAGVLSEIVCDDAITVTDDFAEDAEPAETSPEPPARSFVSLFPAITPTAVAAYNPTLHSAWIDEAVFDISTHYTKGSCVLLNGTLYAVGSGKGAAVLTDVADYSHVRRKDEKGNVKEGDIVLKKDGKVLINGTELKNVSGIVGLDSGYGYTANNVLYAFFPYNGRFIAQQLTDTFDHFLPDQNTQPPELFFDKYNCLYSIKAEYDSEGRILISQADIGIHAPIVSGDNLYVDYQKNLLRLITEPQVGVKKIESYVKDLEYIGTRDGYKLYRYTLNNGRSYEVLSDVQAADSTVLSTKTLDAGSGKTVTCIIRKNRSLNGTCGDKQFTVSNVESVLHAEIIGGQCCVCFLRTDGSIWMYNFDTKACTELNAGSGSGVKGDVNGDGSFNVSDVTLMQRWVGSDGGTIENWKRGDINKDNSLDSIDLALMKRDLIH